MEPRTSNLLDEAIGFHGHDKPDPLSGRFVLVEDCIETSGAFVLHHLLKRFLSSHPASVVIFLAFNHPFAHYDRILRKLGCNLASQRDNSRFFFVDMLMLQCPDEGKLAKNWLAALFEKIEGVIHTLHPDSKNFVSIMIDDVSLLEVAADGSSNDVLDFLHYCLTLTSEYDSTFVALDHKDIYLNGERPILILEMEYLADILIKVEPLATGLAKDVHGQLTVMNKGAQNPRTIPSIKIRNFHFRIKENGTEYFYAGTKT
ncbi:elongator complex protein 6 isoform X1 [Prosopis cineraria]|uniref:elongator complex protein 6 isoform X1 n=1 Tax=Prosopis cineraria TaxID=364024 RepID=UPI00240F243E|nr:elongator complex protein 6 isoform X1 [Prosopis cineraria]